VSRPIELSTDEAISIIFALTAAARQDRACKQSVLDESADKQEALALKVGKAFDCERIATRRINETRLQLEEG
jgi:hypothetical protein